MKSVNNSSVREPMLFRHVVLMFGVALMPIYAFSSGGLQVYHILIIIYCALVFLGMGLCVSNEDRILGILFCIIVGRELVSMVNGESLESLLPAVYLLFSLIVFNAIRRDSLSSRARRAVAVGIFMGVTVATGGIVVFGYGVADQEGLRAVGTFNNPNQLGYYAVCVFSLANLFFLIDRVGRVWYLGLLSMSVFMVMASLSKAALVSVGLVIPVAMLSFWTGRARVVAVILLTLIACTLGVIALRSGFVEGTAVFQRLADIGSQTDDSAEARGYIPWFSFGGWYLLFGLGKLATTRLVYNGHEVASTIGSYFVYYGLLGGLLYLTFCLLWARKIFSVIGLRGAILVCLPVLLFGLTHNGSRFTIYWLLLAVSFSSCATASERSM